jgi:hypothetical protein
MKLSCKKEVYYQTFFLCKCCCDNDIVEGQRCSDRDNEKEQVDG